MPKDKIPPQIELPDTIFKKIRNGTRAIVFKISKNLAAKVLYDGNCFSDTENFTIRRDNKALEQLGYESEIAGYLYDNDIHVPKPVATIEIEILLVSRSKYPAYIMEYLPYKTGAELGYHSMKIAEELARKEMIKAVEQGFTPGKDWKNPNNYFYDENGQRAYLIDFEFWEYDKKDMAHGRIPDYSL